MQQRAVETRQLILEKAAEVFDEGGYRAARIADIMHRAGITQGALYFHFSSKLDLARTVMLAQRDAVVLPPGPDGLQRLIDTTLLLAFELQTNKLLRAGVRLAVEQEEIGFVDDAPYREWAQVFRGQLEAAAKRGELRSHVEVDRLAVLLVGCYTGVQHFSKLANARADLPDRIADLWHYMLLGIAPPQVAAEMVVNPEHPMLAAG
ncbi:transcriptional regulator, TetR family [Streptomyces sp. WMMB 714]|jgi:AcrR family transcriptional regulator|uniref:ScbR family autoregulator-binding transcription factor n=1 Tax=Streptomyces sp. WMMB 714 TaxID=1286822 RepID=UPI0005F78921|nr:ScbR family autoregulator-binding transcription factor [Streptomyces sp. WMMB 714]SCK05766.1 transcriptional regulator, TetR family [Streptomyces sp. WMMB 714]